MTFASTRIVSLLGGIFYRRIPLLLLPGLLIAGRCCAAQDKAAPSAGSDVLVLANGDTLHGKFVDEIAGKVTFHSDVLGDVSVGWDKIKELHSNQKFAVLSDEQKSRRKSDVRKMPEGSLDVADQTVTLHPENAEPAAPIPVKHAQYIMDAATLDKQVNHEPGFFAAWNGAATAGGTLITATQNQYTFSGGVGLVRTVPTADWLDPRNRTTIDFTGSFGKITQPAYRSGGITVPAVTTKSAIYHADAERDQYFSPRWFALAQTAFDHNFAQDLDLQQIYGGGLGWTVLKTPKQEADLKATLQYEKQQFITGGSNSKPNLIGSTLAASYLRHTKLFTYTQGLAYIPAFNDMRAYSANETNTFAFPAYKNLSFSVGTLDSYLNDPPTSLPPTKRNSFEFTMGLTYAIKSKY
ncbi:MAG TPA: DUF481 domain-containing protein [Terracidiphilus sp.]|nr:DUF481 domain-containing protein [Terracidiphilus sp.]